MCPHDFLNDESGNVNVAAAILWITIAGIGAITGLVTLRDGIVQEYGDIGLALEQLDQSYTIYTDETKSTILKQFVDTPNPNAINLPGQAPYGMNLTTPPTNGESDGPALPTTVDGTTPSNGESDGPLQPTP